VPAPDIAEIQRAILVLQDILEAMRRLPGCVDISTDDVRRLYHRDSSRVAGRIPRDRGGDGH
jgi:hypothetical protein